MLVNKKEIARKVLSGEITDTESLNAVLRSMIKDVVETAMGVKPSQFLGYKKTDRPAMSKKTSKWLHKKRSNFQTWCD